MMRQPRSGDPNRYCFLDIGLFPKNHLRSLACFLLVWLISGDVKLPAQSANSNAVVTFTLDFPQSDPSHYSIAVEETGHAKYESTVKDEQKGGEEVYRYAFEVSPASRDRIFQFAKQAKFFARKLDSGNSKIAFSGEKTLSHQDGGQSFTQRYNYSNLESVRNLTDLFQKMAGTLEYGRRLTYFHKYQKLALDEEIARMELQARSNELGEIQGIAPILQRIVDDTTVMNVVRARAKELIRMASAAPQSRQPGLYDTRGTNSCSNKAIKSDRSGRLVWINQNFKL